MLTKWIVAITDLSTETTKCGIVRASDWRMALDNFAWSKMPDSCELPWLPSDIEEAKKDAWKDEFAFEARELAERELQ